MSGSLEMAAGAAWTKCWLPSPFLLGDGDWSNCYWGGWLVLQLSPHLRLSVGVELKRTAVLAAGWLPISSPE